MWKVAMVQPVTEGFGFNITTEANVQLISFAYKTRAEAETAANAQAVVEKAVSVLPLLRPQVPRQWWAMVLDWWNNSAQPRAWD
jgi:hypothetical protein